MSPASSFRSTLFHFVVFLGSLASGCAHASRLEILGRAEKGILYLDGNELVGPFVFKTDGYWMLLDARQGQGGSYRSWKNLVLGDSVGFVPPDSEWKTARPNDVALVMDRSITRAELAGMSDADRLDLAIRTMRDFIHAAVDTAFAERGQGIVYFRGHHEAYRFEIGSQARDSAQAVALGLPRLARADLLKANADGLMKDLAGEWPILRGNGYYMPTVGRSREVIAAKADSLRQGYERVWPSEYDWAREDVRSARPLTGRMKNKNKAFGNSRTPSGQK